MKYSLFFILPMCLCIQNIAIAGETDNYLAIHESIKDSKPLFNQYLNNSIHQALASTPKEKKQSCTQAALQVMQYLGSNNHIGSPALNTKMEVWAEANERIDRYPRFIKDNKQHQNELQRYGHNSIYSPGMELLGISVATLDPTININGIYFGTDKLSHFLGSGYLYYKKYLKILHSQGLSEKQKHIKIIRQYGLANENGIIGKKAAGIFSYADLEANYQGFLLALDLCNGNNPILHFTDKKWQVRPVDMAKYINPNWDESYNSSTYIPSRWASIQANLKRLDYCRKVLSNNCGQSNIHQNYLQQSYQSTDGLISSFSSKLMKAAQQNSDLANKKQNDPYFSVTKADVASLLKKIGQPLDPQQAFSIYNYCQKK